MNEALEYIKSMYNGEIPYRYGRDECAKLMTEYAEYYHKQQVKKLNTPDVSGSDLVKSDWDLRECFNQLRFDKNHHSGLGDIRLTIAQQEEICDLVERFYHCR